MIGSYSVLAIVPARGSSKGLPNKNIKPLAGKPLLAWTIEAARECRYVDRCIVSTDSEAIAEAAREHGAEVPFMRPDELATDKATTLDVILHALEVLPGYDLTVILQPTSPLRTSDDIDHCIERLVETDADSCVTVTPSDKSPHWMYYRDSDGRLEPVIRQDSSATRRQDLRNVFVLNGAVYVTKTRVLLEEHVIMADNNISLEMPRSRSVDIDDELDFQLAELQMPR